MEAVTLQSDVDESTKPISPTNNNDNETKYVNSLYFFIFIMYRPSTWMNKNNKSKQLLRVFGLISCIMSLVSFILLWICLITCYITNGQPTKNSNTPGIWTSLVGLFISIYACYLCYNYQSIPYSRINITFISVFIITSFIIIICGHIMKPSGVWYSIPTYMTFITSIFAVYGAINAQGNVVEKNPNKYDYCCECTRIECCKDKCCYCCKRVCVKEICFRCCCPFWLLLLVLLLCVNSIINANVPDIPGQLYTIKRDKYSYKVQWECSGNRDDSVYNFTIIMSHGGGSNAISMLPLSDTIITNNSNFRVCSYTRPGFAWSEAPVLPDGYNNSITSIPDLITLTELAGETGPYVIIGHSVGGQFAKTFAHINPDNTYAIVLLDSVPQFQWEYVNSLYKNTFQDTVNTYNSRLQLSDYIRYFTPLGLWKLFYPNDYPEEYQNTQWWATGYDNFWNGQWTAQKMESLNYEGSYYKEQQLMMQGILGDIPILNIPAGLNSTCNDHDYTGQQCQDHLEKAVGFWEMQVNQTKTSNNILSTLINCPYPCVHAFAWENATWIADQFISWIHTL